MGYPTTAFFAGHACGGVAFFGPGGQGHFLPGHMGDSLALGLTAISVLGFNPKLFVGLCVIRAEAGNISKRCIT